MHSTEIGPKSVTKAVALSTHPVIRKTTIANNTNSFLIFSLLPGRFAIEAVASWSSAPKAPKDKPHKDSHKAETHQIKHSVEQQLPERPILFNSHCPKHEAKDYAYAEK